MCDNNINNKCGRVWFIAGGFNSNTASASFLSVAVFETIL